MYVVETIDTESTLFKCQSHGCHTCSLPWIPSEFLFSAHIAIATMFLLIRYTTDLSWSCVVLLVNELYLELLVKGYN